MELILRTISGVMTWKPKNLQIAGSPCKLRWSCFFSTPLGPQHPFHGAARAVHLPPPCVFCHHSLQCSWVRRARSLSLHLATQLNIGQRRRQPSGRGLFTKIHFDLWFGWRIVCCWRRRRRRGQKPTHCTHTRASIQITHTRGCLKSPARALFDLIPIAICARWAPHSLSASDPWVYLFVPNYLRTHACCCRVFQDHYLDENH